MGFARRLYVLATVLFFSRTLASAFASDSQNHETVRRVQRHRVRRDPDVHGVDGNHGYVLFAVRRRGGAGRGYVLGLSQIPRLFSKQD